MKTLKSTTYATEVGEKLLYVFYNVYYTRVHYFLTQDSTNTFSAYPSFQEIKPLLTKQILAASSTPTKYGAWVLHTFSSAALFRL